jgi:hypothetical protein
MIATVLSHVAPNCHFMNKFQHLPIGYYADWILFIEQDPQRFRKAPWHRFGQRERRRDAGGGRAASSGTLYPLELPV